jgi:origin recognition complex subunit 6
MATITPSSLKSLGIDKPKKISSKANELIRLLDVKCPLGLPNSIQPFGTFAKNTICIELACKLYSINFAKEDAVKSSGVSMIEYQTALITIQNLLNVKFPVSIQELCVQFGCPGMKATVERLLEQYKEKFMASLANTTSKVQPEKEKPQKHVDFSNPAFKAAAFFLCARNCKLKVDKQKLIQHTNCNPIQFNNVCESMEKLCDFKMLLSASTFQEFREKSKKRKREKENEEDKQLEDEEGLKEIVDCMKSAPVKAADSTERSKIIKKDDTTNTKDACKRKQEEVKPPPPPRKKLRQMNLNFFVEKS